MADGDLPSAASPKVDDIVAEAEIKEEHDAGDEASSEAPQAPARSGESVTAQQYKALKEICDLLTNHKIAIKGDEDYYPSLLFRRIPNKRNFADYHEVIKEPVAISTLKGKTQRKEYNDMKEPVRDFAMIVHNAQVYNRANSQPVRDVLELKKVFEEELTKLVENGLIAEEDTVFPYLGEIPYSTPEPDPISEEEEEGEEEEEEDDEGDESDEEKGKRGRRRGARASIAGRKRARSPEEEDQKGNEERKRRGRPPRVDTPMEARIKAVLKGIRKPKDEANQLKIRHFERLPDKAANPGYYQEIKEPIAVDIIKRKSKRKKYQSLEHFVKDIELMFKNAMQYNEDESDIYKDASDLLAEAQKLVDAERQKPDSEYMMEDGRIPLPDGILHGSEIYKVGDWVHIQNQNDITKPIVAQIYRTWKDPEGQEWINACWYYRPEQTVHQFEKHFYPNEVVKTGQYRDHRVEEIVDRCFVMFFTRYSRGRPRNFDSTKEVYVCEARYNEEKHKMNKIKTWASCLPDEVREKDYEMDLFDQPRKIKKVPSPLLHLLKDEQKDDDEPPQPEWKHPNAPPVTGAIYRGPRDENQSPPPEPTPPPPPTPPPQPARTPAHTMMPRQPPRADADAHGDTNVDHTQQTMRTPLPVQSQQSQPYQATSASPAPPYGRRESSFQPQSSTAYLTPQASVPQTPRHHAAFNAQQHNQQAPGSLSAAHPSNYSSSATPNQPSRAQQAAPILSPHYPVYPAQGNYAPRGTEAYILSDAANNMIPEYIRKQFPCDDDGRVLWFTTPPVDTGQYVYHDKSVKEQNQELMHSLKHLSRQIENQIQEQRHRRKGEQAQGENESATKADEAPITTESASFKQLKLDEACAMNDSPPYKRLKPGTFGEQRDTDGRIRASSEKAKEAKDSYDKHQKELAEKKDRAYEKLCLTTAIKISENFKKNQEYFYKYNYGDRWKELMEEDEKKHLEEMKNEHERKEKWEKSEMKMKIENSRQPGRGIIPTEEWMAASNPWGRHFKDDYDPRY